MLLFKRLLKGLSGIIFALAIILNFNAVPVFAANGGDYLYLGGFPAGFVLNTKNVEVIGTCDILTDAGAVCPAREVGIKSGDIIDNVNGVKIESAADLTKLLNEDFAEYKLGVKRNNETLDIKIEPIKDKSSGKKRFGLLVKDCINGIGTVTYIDKENNKFGSLGHPVTDAEGNLIPINGGTLYGCNIYDIKKGLRGNPGELKGIFDNSKMMGVIYSNTPCGIFGNISSEYDTSGLKKIKAGSAEEAVIGKATIYSTLHGDRCDEYEVSIVKVDKTNKDNRNFVIKINDNRIIENAGGIVQGMSGSPIVQNGKLIGAVTHVFVNDPTRGYGISLDCMTNS